MTEVTLLTKPDCHLCGVAREVIDVTLADLPESVAGSVEVTETSILDDDALYEKWWEKIPVVLIDGELHDHWRVSQDRLAAALRGKAS
ncbi:MAG: glutaredoxin family protein [Microbacterium gubbeenense]|uniref:glutaredoxin family protein n=1 Tax=Microbacterium gubbeenense TaxID=159896 RepID=UPI0003F56BE6|nr:glutaredoxin family protein [Microbacterium gubbeenense]